MKLACCCGVTLAGHITELAWKSLLSDGERQRLERMAFRDAGHGYDVLGLHPPSLAVALGAGRFAYERYFRVCSHGAENVPARGAAILACNHSGTLPVDAAMVVADVIRHTEPPRVARAVGDLFIPLLPWFGALFSRLGVVGGSRENFRYLLESGELALVFPEGTPGIGKGFRRRYELAAWRVGHAELALRHRVPVVPVAVIGAEEAWPQVARLNRFHLFGAPFLPIPLTPVPLPARYHIYYDSPLSLHDDPAFADVDDPAVCEAAAAEVKRRVSRLIDRGIAERKGWFR